MLLCINLLAIHQQDEIFMWWFVKTQTTGQKRLFVGENTNKGGSFKQYFLALVGVIDKKRILIQACYCAVTFLAIHQQDEIFMWWFVKTQTTGQKRLFVGENTNKGGSFM